MIRNWLRTFMIGRYGPDQLNLFLLILAVIVSFVAGIVGLFVLTVVSYALLILAMFRMLSKNIYKRRGENDKFLRFWWPVRQWFVKKFQRMKSRKTHRFFKCPACKNVLRVPKGKGTIQITCPKCGERFTRKT